ncbi:hypothetical protein PQG02_06955 [Nostoc sp. UHCC 0926]|uniref:hypothetical protein n=1 Tax=unclassified Nostoc TaxID=2593658 RepID=UPI002362C688|nr:hypothetical protein [Nostoc sp. UHCC 0926]WDD34080.1 hypothetical protein PQG02_06955 [Nostoc sp. UHCC 0926]
MPDDKIYIPPDTWRDDHKTSVIATGATTTPIPTPTVTAATPPEDGLPDNFDPFQHLKEVYRPQHNAAVRLFFSDHPDDWKPNIATARASLRVACTIDPGDNELMIAMRHRLLFDILGYGNSNLVVYNGSKNDIAPPVDGHPKVYFYFSQDIESVPVGSTRADAEYSFRLMHETAATITQAKLTALATLIKQHFVVEGVSIHFTKGKNIYRYSDPINGYRLMVYAHLQTDALPIIEKMLECQEIAYDENLLSIHTPEKSNTTTPVEKLVYGKEVKPPKFRPNANVRFRYAYVEIPLVKKPIYLVDTTHRHIPLVH